MTLARVGIVTATMLALLAAGCTSQRFARLDTRQPEPLTPAPAGTVDSSQLPPPTDPLGPNEFPEAPGEDEEREFAELDTETAENAPDITAGSIAGVWNVAVSGESCRVATPQTKFGEGFRAGPLRCPSPLDQVKSWNVEGKQLAFYNDDGSVLARFYSSGPERFDGRTTSGLPVSLSR